MPYMISSRTFGKVQKLLKQDANDEARTVVFFDYGDFQGHFNPTLEFARLFVTQGHTVYFFASEMVKERVEDAGAIFQPYDLSANVIDQTETEPPYWTLRKEAVRQLRQMGYDDASEKIGPDQPFVALFPAALGLLERGLVDRVKALQPDVIIADFAMTWGAMVSEILGIPLISSVSCTYCPMDTFADAMGLRELVEESAHEDYMQAVMAKLLTKYGLINHSGVNQYKHLSEFQIAWTIPEFDVEAAIAMKKSRYMKCYGSSMPPLLEDEERIIQEDLKGFPVGKLKQLKAQGKTVIYCSMGTVAGQFSFLNGISPVIESVVCAYGNDPNTVVVLSVGPKLDLQTLPEMPSNFYMRRSVPQKTILGIADVFISHMGNNSANEAIFMGCPMVAIPNFADQNINATRAAELGIAVHIPSPFAPKPAENLEHVTPQVLKNAVDTVLIDPSYKASALRLRDVARQRRRHFEKEAPREVFDYVDECHQRAAAKEVSKVLQISSCSRPIRARHVDGKLHTTKADEIRFSRIASH